MKFTNDLWESTRSIYDEILSHPFNRELAAGTLDKAKFLFYMQQDAYYLISFARALALIAGRTNSSKKIHQFNQFSLGALVAERELHANFLPEGLRENIIPSPSCLAYTQYLIATSATASLEEAISAVLPCFWIYREVGNTIALNCARDNPYIQWIDAYSSREFSDATDKAICLVNEVATLCAQETLQCMKTAFCYSTIFEWHFWNDAYTMNVFEIPGRIIYDIPY